MTTFKKQLFLLLLDCVADKNKTKFADGLDGPGTKEACNQFKAKYGAEPTEDNFIAAICGALGEVVTGNNVGGKTGTFWDSIKYVPRVEWRCPCGRCGGFPVEPQERIVSFLEALRVHFNKPVYISSGVRCQTHNDELPGSVWNSRHVSGKAVDFCVEGMSATPVKVYCDRLVAQGVLRYCYCIDNQFVHADIL